MPRQPYLRVVPSPKRGAIDFNVNLTRQRQELHALVGDCLLAWPYVEAEMAVVLAELMRADNAVATAVFQTIRRSSSQRECTSVAASASHGQQTAEVVGAILNVTKSVEASRNALAHGHLGVSNALPNDLIWIETADYDVRWRSYVSVIGGRWDNNNYRHSARICVRVS